METAEKTSLEKPEMKTLEDPRATPAVPEEGGSIWIDPDLDFIQTLSRQGGDFLKKCMQCGTCSATCAISPDSRPFPCKEMSWAAWGMKDHLLKDPDVWLCYQCNDCSKRCPRAARPGDVMAAIRRMCVLHYAFPRFLGRWVNQPQCIPLLLGIPVALLTLALLVKNPVEDALGLSRSTGPEIMYSYSSVFPHWLLNSFFFFFSFLALLAVCTGVGRFWRAMGEFDRTAGRAAPANSLPRSIATAVKSIFTHEKFAECTKARPRYWSHLCVFFGFLALSLVTTWIITAKINPLVRGDFIYPFSFWSPWKLLANAGGLALLAGCLLMIRDRIKDSGDAGAGSYFDWALIATLLLVVLTGFATEALHYVRLEPHRHLAYFVHLVFVFTLLIYLPYSKLAHVAYRTAAIIYAEYSGRDRPPHPEEAAAGKAVEEE